MNTIKLKQVRHDFTQLPRHDPRKYINQYDRASWYNFQGCK